MPAQTIDVRTVLRGLTPVTAGPAATAPHPSRVLPATAAKLPVDTVAAAAVMAGVRLELAGTATTARLSVTTHPAPGSVAPTMTPAFSVWLGDQRHSRVEVTAGTQIVEVPLPPRPAAASVTVYLPDSVPVTIDAIQAVGGTLLAPPGGLRWLAYGDSITQGWSATDPGLAWPAVTARHLGLDVINLGFAGSARGELPAAAQLAETAAEVITLAWGTNCWSSIPMDAPYIEQVMRLFLTTVRQGHPDVPIIVISPIVRPAAEHTANLFGATLTDLRNGIERAAGQIAAGDDLLALIPGRDLIREDELVDGIHPGDDGHSSLASALIPILADCLTRSPAWHQS
jgi:lysophospholipase L1-like esterase